LAFLDSKSKNRLFAILSVLLFVGILVLSAYALVDQSSALTNSGGEWTSFIFDNNDSRYQASSTITSSNVGSLTEAWFFPANYSVTSTPIVQNGQVYFSDWGGNVYALNVNTGSEVWKTNVGFAISSTPALANGLVYVAGSPLKPSRVIALSESTGAIVWNTTLRTTPGGIYASPIVYNGLLYIGISNCHTTLSGCSEQTTSLVGEVDALNAETGAPVWRFVTGNDTGNGGWGAGVWGSVVVDPSLNSIYFGTGNAFQNTSSACNTCSLYAYSILSLDASTGKLNWYDQVYKNWLSAPFADDDFGSTPNLFSVMKNGMTYQVVGLMIKSGTYYILNRQNGNLLYTLQVKDSTAMNIGVGGFVYPSGTVNPEIFLPAGSGSVQAFEPSNGLSSPIWTSIETSGIMDGSEVALIPGAVLVGDGNGSLYAFSMSNGATLFSQKLPNLQSGYGIYSGVTVAEGFVLVGDYDYVLKESSSVDSGGLYAFSLPSTRTTTMAASSTSTAPSSSTSLTYTSMTAGSAINPSSNQSITTTPSAPPPTTSRTSSSGGQSSFPIITALIIGVVVVAVVILGATLFIRRRS
jgi:polyvinyl alcohol dehydrogenase (cytochrome)